ncbi:MAG: cobalamin biosynthesis protein [Clostridia bacterium]
MNVNIFSYSNQGCELAIKISKIFENSRCFAIEKFAKKYNLICVSSTTSKAREVFPNSDLLIFIGACGIAVRAIAPVIQSKTTDPACLVIDDGGNFVIPILSGHIGGANDFCRLISHKIGASSIITTATDVNNRFSVDSFAKKQNLKISDMHTAMEFSAEILTCDLPILVDENVKIKTNLSNGIFHSKTGDFGLYIGNKTVTPYKKTLQLIPSNLTVGIGCRKNISMENIEKLFLKVFNDNNLQIRSVNSINSIDIKSNEYGLLEFCKKYDFPINFYTSSELLALNGNFTSSNFVKSVTGVDNVCERSAIKASNNGKILIYKTSLDGVTIAVASEEKEIYFE